MTENIISGLYSVPDEEICFSGNEQTENAIKLFDKMEPIWLDPDRCGVLPKALEITDPGIPAGRLTITFTGVADPFVARVLTVMVEMRLGKKTEWTL